jgi:hypothetical protein
MLGSPPCCDPLHNKLRTIITLRIPRGATLDRQPLQHLDDSPCRDRRRLAARLTSFSLRPPAASDYRASVPNQTLQRGALALQRTQTLRISNPHSSKLPAPTIQRLFVILYCRHTPRTLSNLFASRQLQFFSIIVKPETRVG